MALEARQMNRTVDTQAHSRVATFADGAIVFDPDCVPQAAADRSLFATGARRAGMGGRGAAWFVDGPCGPAVLRHYRRGGLVARIADDAYVYTGRERTRPFREFRLLQRLAGLGLPVPAPVAAGFRRSGPLYTADLLTARIAGARSLAEMLQGGMPAARHWNDIGATIARFHAAGAWHADLNAHNVLLDDTGRVWLIDFDRGRMRAPSRAWQQRNLDRLLRSLRKLGTERFGASWLAAWSALLASWNQGLERQP